MKRGVSQKRIKTRSLLRYHATDWAKRTFFSAFTGLWTVKYILQLKSIATRFPDNAKKLSSTASVKLHPLQLVRNGEEDRLRSRRLGFSCSHIHIEMRMTKYSIPLFTLRPFSRSLRHSQELSGVHSSFKFSSLERKCSRIFRQKVKHRRTTSV